MWWKEGEFYLLDWWCKAFFHVLEVGLYCYGCFTIQRWFCDDALQLWKTITVDAFYWTVYLENLSVDLLSVFIAFVNVLFLFTWVSIFQVRLNLLIDQVIDLIHMPNELFILQQRQSSFCYSKSFLFLDFFLSIITVLIFFFLNHIIFPLLFVIKRVKILQNIII